jgi:hypothetical protein
MARGMIQAANKLALVNIPGLYYIADVVSSVQFCCRHTLRPNIPVTIVSRCDVSKRGRKCYTQLLSPCHVIIALPATHQRQCHLFIPNKLFSADSRIVLLRQAQIRA